MPKIKKLRQYFAAARTNPYGNGEQTQVKGATSDSAQPPVLTKKERLLQRLAEQHGKGPKASKRKGDEALSDIEASLPAAVARPAALAIKTNKMKKAVAIRETERMKLVQQHPLFISNPLDAVKQHLQQMMASKTAALNNNGNGVGGASSNSKNASDKGKKSAREKGQMTVDESDDEDDMTGGGAGGGGVADWDSNKAMKMKKKKKQKNVKMEE